MQRLVYYTRLFLQLAILLPIGVNVLLAQCPVPFYRGWSGKEMMIVIQDTTKSIDFDFTDLIEDTTLTETVLGSAAPQSDRGDWYFEFGDDETECNNVAAGCTYYPENRPFKITLSGGEEYFMVACSLTTYTSDLWFYCGRPESNNDIVLNQCAGSSGLMLDPYYIIPSTLDSTGFLTNTQA